MTASNLNRALFRVCDLTLREVWGFNSLSLCHITHCKGILRYFGIFWQQSEMWTIILLKPYCELQLYSVYCSIQGRPMGGDFHYWMQKPYKGRLKQATTPFSQFSTRTTNHFIKVDAMLMQGPVVILYLSFFLTQFS